MFVKGQKVGGGERLSAEKRAKIIEMRKAGNKWKDIAAALDVSVKRAMTWAKRGWYKKGMSAEVETKKDDDKKEETPTVETKESKKGNGEGKKEKDEKVGEVGKAKAKAKADKIVTDEIRKHIKKDDKALKSVSKAKGKGKDTKGVDKVAKKGLSVSKSVGMWLLLAVILAVVVIAVVFLLLKPGILEKKEYGKPTPEEKEKSQPGYDNRNVDDL